MKDFIKREDDPDFSHRKTQETFVGQTQTDKALLQKEIDVNLSEQELLRKRISTMKALLNDLPSHHPQYSALAIQIEMDAIDINELQIRFEKLKSLLTK